MRQTRPETIILPPNGQLREEETEEGRGGPVKTIKAARGP